MFLSGSEEQKNLFLNDIFYSIFFFILKIELSDKMINLVILQLFNNFKTERK